MEAALPSSRIGSAHHDRGYVRNAVLHDDERRSHERTRLCRLGRPRAGRGMKARRRYQIAFFALGWLIAIGLLFQMGLGEGFQSLYDAFGTRALRLAQSFSDAEGNALRTVRHTSRSEYLLPLRPTLSSATALRNPPRMLFGAYDGGFPNTFAGLEKFEAQVQYKFPIIS